MKGQVSAELMVIIGIILALFIPLLVTVYFKTTEANEQLYQVQAELLSTRLAYMINSVGNLGEGSSIVAEIFIPPRVTGISLNTRGRGGEVIVTMNTQNGPTEIVDVTRFPVRGTFTHSREGLRRFNISHIGNDVRVEEVTTRV